VTADYESFTVQLDKDNLQKERLAQERDDLFSYKEQLTFETNRLIRAHDGLSISNTELLATCESTDRQL
jgi:hypothetical protein